MLKIEDNRMYFHQWDMNQRLLVENEEIKEVHYSNGGDTALICEVFENDGKRYVNVPNILLQTEWTIKAYAVCGDCITRDATSFIVMPRAKPADYVYTETEVKTYAALAERIEALENAETPEQGESKAVIVTITKDEEFNFTADKTYNELREALDNGQVVRCKLIFNPKVPYYINYIELNQIGRSAGEEVITFSGLFNPFIASFWGNYIEINMHRDNTIYTYYREYPTSDELPSKLPNPKNLIIKENGVKKDTYDGRFETEIDIPLPTTTLPWEAITGKPFGEGGVIYEQTHIVQDANEPMVMMIAPFTLNDGGEYTVTINATEYECTAENSELMGMPCVVLGNLAFFGGDNNGMPFLIGRVNTPVDFGDGTIVYGALMVDNTVMDVTQPIDVKIEQSGNKKIDSEYIPTATDTVKGGVIVGDGLIMDGDVLSVNDMPVLVATLTVEEASVWAIINKDTNGNDFALKNANVLVVFPDGTPEGQIYLGVKSYRWVSFNGDGIAKKYMRVRIEPIGEGLWTGYTTFSRDLIISGSTTYSIQYCDSGDNAIKNVVLYLPNKVPAGTIINVYGVRA